MMLRGKLSNVQEQIARMTLPELIEYEATLWVWYDKLGHVKIGRSKKVVRIFSDSIVAQLNAIHREVEWRAGEKEWRNAAHS